MNVDVKTHYDLLIEENNDPVYDSVELKNYMDKFDGDCFERALLPLEEKTVLEIGVGTGRLAKIYAPIAYKFVGIDFSQKTIERAKENLKEQANILFVCDDFLNYQFGETFDVIYSSLTMMHFRQKKQVVAKVDTLLNKGGIFCLSIDKNQSEYIDMGTRKVRVYPDTLENTQLLIQTTAMSVSMVLETDNAYIIVSKKQSNKFQFV